MAHPNGRRPGAPRIGQEALEGLCLPTRDSRYRRAAADGPVALGNLFEVFVGNPPLAQNVIEEGGNLFQALRPPVGHQHNTRRLVDHLALGELVDHIDEGRDRLDWRRGQHPMAQIEDVARPAGGGLQYGFNLAPEGARWGV